MKRVFVRSLLILSLRLLVVGVPVEAQAATRATMIPFELLDHLIVMQCKINDAPEPYSFILDTGGLTAIDKALADELKLKQRGPQAKIDSLRVGDCAVDKVFVFTGFDLQPLRDAYGIDVSGIIGSDLLEDYIVTIDYAARRLTLSTDMESLAAEKNSNGAGYLLKFTRHPVNHAPMIRCTLDGGIGMEAMVDTGQPYALVLPLGELERTGAARQESTLKARGVVVKWPGTSSPDTYLARLKSLEADSLKVNGIVTVFAELPSLLSVPLLGGDFLSRYIIKLDYLHGEMLLIPSSGYAGSDHAFSTGLSLTKNAENQLVVRGIWEKSPADRAGIQVDDRIIEFDSRKVTPELHRDLWMLMNDSATESVELLLETKQGLRKVLLKKERLI